MERMTTTDRKKAVWGGRVALALVVGILLLASTSCSEAIRTGQSPGYLIVNSLQGAPGTGTFGSTLASDVIADNGGIFADQGQITLQLQMKDPQLAPSPNNAAHFHLAAR